MTFDLRNDAPSPPKKTMKESENEAKSSEAVKPVLVDYTDVAATASGRAAVQRSLAYLKSYQDDIDCKYSLACNDLKTLLTTADAQASNMIWRMGDFSLEQHGLSFKGKKPSNEKLLVAYKKCSRLQVQRNRVAHSIKFMGSILAQTTPIFDRLHPFLVTHTRTRPSYSQLQSYCELMLNTFLTLPHGVYNAPNLDPGVMDVSSVKGALISPEFCCEFFGNLVQNGNPRLRVQTAAFLLAFSSPFPWWGEFIAQILTESFQDSDFNQPSLPQEHLFATLLALGQRCLSTPEKAENIIKNLLNLLKKLLNVPGEDAMASDEATGHQINLNLLTWVLLYVSHLTETISAQNEWIMNGGGTAPSEDTPDSVPAPSTTSTSTAAATDITIPGQSSMWPSEAIMIDDLLWEGVHVQYPGTAPFAKHGSVKKVFAHPPVMPMSSDQGNSSNPSTSKPTPASSKAMCNTKDTSSKDKWNFVSISGDATKDMPSLSGYNKVLDWMQSINKGLKHHRSELLKIFKEKRSVMNELKNLGSPPKTQSMEYTTLHNRLQDLTNRANGHHRNVISYRRSLDRKNVKTALNKVKPQDSNGKEADESLYPTSFIGVSVEACKTVVRSLLHLLLRLDFTVPADFVVIACKLSSQLCQWTSAQCIHTAGQKSPEVGAKDQQPVTRPILLSELLEKNELKKLLLFAAGGSVAPNRDHDVHFGSEVRVGPWVMHSLMTLLQTILESENVALSSCEMELFPTSYKNWVEYLTRAAMEEPKENSSELEKKNEQETPENPTESEKTSEKEETENLKNTEYAKRMELVDNFIKMSQDHIEDIKMFMKLKGENPETQSNAATPPTPTNVQVLDRWKRVVEKEGSDKQMPLTGFLRGIRLGHMLEGRVVTSQPNRQLLCSHIHDNRVINGVVKDAELKMKLWTMEHLKLLSNSIAQPFTDIAKTYKDDETSIHPEPPVSMSGLESFHRLRLCICEILLESSENGLPMTNFFELIIQLQETYNETMDVTCEFVKETLTVLGKQGAAALLQAITSDHGSNFFNCPQLWSLGMDLIATVLDENHRFVENAEYADFLFRPSIKLNEFFVAMLSSKMSASNIPTGQFHQTSCLLGPSVCNQFKQLLHRFEETSSLSESFSKSLPGEIPCLLLSYRNFLLQIIFNMSSSGAFGHASSTPSDGQIVLIEAFINLMQKEKVGNDMMSWQGNVSILVDIVKNVAKTAYEYLRWSETAVLTDSNRGVDPRSCMSGLFKTLTATSLQNLGKKVDSPRDTLMLKLLQMCSELVWLTIPKGNSPKINPTSPEQMDTTDKEELMETDLKEDSPKEMEVDNPKQSPSKYEKLSDFGYETFGSVLIREDARTIQYLMASLALCTGSGMASLLSSLNVTPIAAVEKAPISTGDGILLLLCGIFSPAVDSDLPIKAIVNYLTGFQNSEGKYTPQTMAVPTTRLSLPLLWLILSVLDEEERVEQFCALGGARLITDSLVFSAKESIGQSQGRTSKVLKYLKAASDRANAFAPRPLVVLHNEANWPQLAPGNPVQKVTASGQGFNYPPLHGAVPVSTAPGPAVKVLSPPWGENKEFDFAAVATIECSDVSAQPADSLLKPKAIHRRSRTPLWSYHYPENEHWVSLTLRFPTAFVLRSVKLMPMLMSLSTSPSSVLLEISRVHSQNSNSFQPVSSPINTTGVGEIIVVPPRDEVVVSIRIHLKRPLDSSSVGLTRIVVNGVTNFMNYEPASGSKSSKPFSKSISALNNDTDRNRNSTTNWLRLLHHCLTLEDGKLAPRFHDAFLEVNGLIPTLCALLERPVQNLYLTTIERVLLQTAIPEKAPELIGCLLRGSSGFNSRFIGGFSQSATDSSIDIMYALCDKECGHLELRFKEMLKWIAESATTFGSLLSSVDASHVHAIACGLWACSNTDAARSCVTLELTKMVYDWNQSLGRHSTEVSSTRFSSPLKSALNWLLCSFCNISTDNFLMILDCMGLNNVDMTSVSLTNSQIETLTSISQSEECIKILCNRGIVQCFSIGLQQFCHLLARVHGIEHEDVQQPVMEISSEIAISVIEFFSALSDVTVIQDWLGSDEGRKTWQILLKTMHEITMPHSQYSSLLPRQLLLDLQESTINLLKQMTKCNEHNQQLFTRALCDIVSRQSSASSRPTQLSGFIRSLLLRVVLEDESYTVTIQCGSGQKFYKGKSNSFVRGSASLRHPSFGSGHFTRTFEVGVSATVKQVWAMASDAPFAMDKFKKHIPESVQPKQSSKVENDDKKPTGASVPYTIPGVPTTYAAVIKPPTAVVLTPPTPYGELLMDVITSGKNAQYKRKPKLLNSSESSSQTTKSESLLIPTVSLKCPSLGDEKLGERTKMIELLTKYKAQNVQSFWKCINLEFTIVSDSKSPPDGSKTETKNADEPVVAMETNDTNDAAKASESKQEQPETTDSQDQVKSSSSNDKPVKTMLQVFASLDGLALVAEHLPTVTLDIGHTSVSSSVPDPPLDQVDQPEPWEKHEYSSAHWVKEEDWFGSEDDDDYYETLPQVSKMFPNPISKKPAPPILSSSASNPCVPSHTMSALCLFLRVPYFAEEFLSKQKAARCLLRLMLGVQDDGNGEQILKLDLAQSLPILPFTAVCSLLSLHDPTSTSGLAIRESMTFTTTSIHLVLACLSRFTHNQPNEDTPAGRLLASLFPEQETAPINVAPPTYKGPTTSNAASKRVNFANKQSQGEKSYWAKGTGFGTGSTTSDWDVGNAVKKQKKDERYITVLLEVLANFVCPESKDVEETERKSLPMDGKFKSIIPELLSASGLIPAIASYLRNDSVLDMAHHVPLYCSLLSVIRSFAVCPTLCRLLMDSTMTTRQSQDGSSPRSTSDSILSLLTKMRKCIDTYASRLKAINTSIDSQGEEGLTTFVLNVQKTESMLTKLATEIKVRDKKLSESSDISGPSTRLSISSDSLEKRYIEEMKNLQFDTAELVVEQEDGTLKFPSNHHYATHIKEAANVSDASRARRLAQETVTLSNSLPLSHSSTVFVRCDDERLDVMKVLITGPADTPYANGCFEFDIFFPADYNNSPPLVNLRTTGNHSVRFNPNLYNDGKVCLSILNTWHGRPEEKWNPHTSSFLQILVSIQSLILVSEPYFNEPGYERSRGTPAGEQSSKEYDANIQQATVRWAMLEQIKSPSPCFKDIIEHHFWLKRDEILSQCDKWMSDMKKQANQRQGRRPIAHNYTALQRHVTLLKTELAKMNCPEGLEDTQMDLTETTDEKVEEPAPDSDSASKSEEKN